MNIIALYSKYEKYVVLLLRLVIGGMFIYSAYTKFQQPVMFETIVRGYGMLPDFIVDLFASLLPWAEVLVGTALLLGIFKRQSAYIVLLMLLMFIIAVSYQIIRGNTGDCGCGLPGEDFTEVLIRDFVMFVATVLIVWSDTAFLELVNRKLY